MSESEFECHEASYRAPGKRDIAPGSSEEGLVTHHTLPGFRALAVDAMLPRNARQPGFDTAEFGGSSICQANLPTLLASFLPPRSRMARRPFGARGSGALCVIIHPFARFLLVVIGNTALGYGVIMVRHYGFGIEPIPANVVGYTLGAFLSYMLSHRYTFASQRLHAEALPRFVLAVAGCFMLNLMVLKFGLSALGLPFALAQALAISSYTVVFYLTSRLLVFRT